MVVALVEHFFDAAGRERFPQWVREIAAAARRYEGFVSIRPLSMPDAPERCFFLLEFETPATMQRWADSDERRVLLDAMAPHRLKPLVSTRFAAGRAHTRDGE